MKTDMWMPLYVADYLADTAHLTTEQHGAYLLLIMTYWRHGELPDDDGQLAAIVKFSPHKWKKNSQIIRKFFHEKDGVLRHKRIDAERSKAAENRERKTEIARKAADARWQKDDADALPDACPSPSPSPTVSSKDDTLFGDASADAPAVPATTKAKPPSSSKRGTRLSPDFEAPGEWIGWAMREGLDLLTAEREIEKFKDYWCSKAGANATKVDWDATWRNWIRNAIDRGMITPAHKQGDILDAIIGGNA